MKEGWSRKRLEDVTTKIGSGATPKGGSKSYKDAGIPLIRSLNIHDGEFRIKNLAFIDLEQASKLSNVIVEKGDVLLNITGASIARCCVVPAEYLPARVNQHVAIIRPIKEVVCDEYLGYLLISKECKDSLLQTGNKAGATRQALTKVQLQNFDIPLPPLPEQKRIVGILDEAFEGIDAAISNTEKNLVNARELFDSYLNDVFTKESEEWENTTVEALVSKGILDKPLDGNHGEIHPKKADFVELGVPFVMASNLVNGKLDQVNCNFISKEQADSLRKGFARTGDVLLSHKGTIGRAAVLTTEHDYVILTPQVTYYRIIDDEVLHNRYLYYFLQSPNFQAEIGHLAGAGSTRAYIGITKQLQLPISYPRLDIQLDLVVKFDELTLETQRLESIYKQKLDYLTCFIHRADRWRREFVIFPNSAADDCQCG